MPRLSGEKETTKLLESLPPLDQFLARDLFAREALGFGMSQRELQALQSFREAGIKPVSKKTANIFLQLNKQIQRAGVLEFFQRADDETKAFLEQGRAAGFVPEPFTPQQVESILQEKAVELNLPFEKELLGAGEAPPELQFQLAFSPDIEGVRSALEARFGKDSVVELASGGLAYKPTPESPPIPLNKSGLTAGDIGMLPGRHMVTAASIVGEEVGGAAATGLGAGAPGILAGRMIGAGILSGVAELMRHDIATTLNVETGESTSDAFKRAKKRSLFEALVTLPGEALSFGGKLLTREKRGIFKPRIRPEATRAFEEFGEEFNVFFTPGQATWSTFLDIWDAVGRKSFGGKRAGEEILEAQAETGKAIGKQLARELGEQLTPTEAGQVLLFALRKKEAMAMQRSVWEFTGLDELTTGRGIGGFPFNVFKFTKKKKVPVSLPALTDPFGRPNLVSILDDMIVEPQGGAVRLDLTENIAEVFEDKLGLRQLDLLKRHIFQSAKRKAELGEDAFGLKDLAAAVVAKQSGLSQEVRDVLGKLGRSALGILEQIRALPDNISFEAAQRIRSGIASIVREKGERLIAGSDADIGMLKLVDKMLTQNMLEAAERIGPKAVKKFAKANADFRAAREVFENDLLVQFAKQAIKRPQNVGKILFESEDIALLEALEKAGLSEKDLNLVLSSYFERLIRSSRFMDFHSGQLKGKALKSWIENLDAFEVESRLFKSPEVRRRLRAWVDLLDIQQREAESRFGELAIQFTQFRALLVVGTAAAAAFTTGHHGAGTASLGVAGFILLTPWAYARLIMSSKAGTKWMLEGMKLPAATERGIRATSRVLSELLRPEVLSTLRPGDVTFIPAEQAEEIRRRFGTSLEEFLATYIRPAQEEVGPPSPSETPRVPQDILQRIRESQAPQLEEFERRQQRIIPPRQE